MLVLLDIFEQSLHTLFIFLYLGEDDAEHKHQVKRLLKKVEEMQTQRVKLELELRQDLHNDDITKELVTNQNPPEEFFETQLNKHNKLVSYI